MTEKFNKEELYKLYIEEGKTAKEIAALYDVSVSRVRKAITRYGIKKFSEEHIQKRICTMKEKYGCVSPMQNPEIKRRMRETILERYGVPCTLMNEEVNKKARSTMQELYGGEYSGLSSELMARKNDTMLKKYGRKTYTQIGIGEQSVDILSSKEKFLEYINCHPRKTCAEIAQELGYSRSSVEKRVFEWGLESEVSHNWYASVPEREIRDLLESWGLEVKKEKKILWPLEIDIYCPKFKIGVEFNGNWYHRASRMGDLYHQNKSLKAEEKGIFIYHIFEYEWDSPKIREQIINNLRNLFQLNTQKLFARKCVIREVSTKEKTLFLEKNHIQGATGTKVNLGLYYQEELVSIMCFNKFNHPKNKKQYDWELTRFCSKSGMNVVGAASKLFKAFLTHYEGSVVSYSNITKTKGGLYSKLGFRFKGIGKPNYVWTGKRKGEFLTRYQTQFKNEKEIMESKGYVRVCDAGTKVWEYIR